jgi:hypothetical protein
MKISCVNTNNINFRARYKTEDVLMLATKCTYKDRDTDKIIKSLTGIDMYSDEFRKSVSSDENYVLVTFALEDVCENKVIEQVPQLGEARKQYIKELKNLVSRESRTKWIEEQKKKFGKTMELKPFTVTREEIKKAYNNWVEIVEESQHKLWEISHKKS